jgi:hypothetical protein
MHLMELLDDVDHVESHFGPFGYCVCAERTIGTEIVFDAPDGTPRFEAQEEAPFSPFAESDNLDAR